MVFASKKEKNEGAQKTNLQSNKVGEEDNNITETADDYDHKKSNLQSSKVEEKDNNTTEMADGYAQKKSNLQSKEENTDENKCCKCNCIII